MYDDLKKYCQSKVAFSHDELELIDEYFEVKQFKKKDKLLEEGRMCNFLAFVSVGSVRHFHTKDGTERTCDISFENSWVTDFQSFTKQTPCIMNLQAEENTTVIQITRTDLLSLYDRCHKYETFGRLMTENVLQRATEITMSLSSSKPEERFQNLFKSRPDLFQRVSQKHIANLLGISPESLSRIRNRTLKKLRS